jgi:alkylhydroperoxidase family enzyme
MNDILGQAPRLAPLPVADLDAKAMAVVDRLRGIFAITAEVPVSQTMATLFRHPGAAAVFFETGMHFMTASALSPRDRELAILRTGWLCGAPFEWGEHVASGKKIGLMAEEIEWITQGSTAPGWSADDRIILRAVEELHEGAMISDDTWAALARRLDGNQLIELPMLVGHYHQAAFVQNALRLPLRSTNAGLFAR